MTYFKAPVKAVRELTAEEKKLVIERSQAKFRARMEEEAAEELAKLMVQFLAAPAAEQLLALEQRFGSNAPKRENVVAEKVQNNGWDKDSVGEVDWSKQDKIGLGSSRGRMNAKTARSKSKKG